MCSPTSRAAQRKYNASEHGKQARKAYREKKKNGTEEQQKNVFESNTPEIEITTSYWQKRNKYDTYVSEAFDNGGGVISLYSPDNEDKKRKSKNEVQITYKLQHGIAGKNSYGINWDNVNVVTNGITSRTFHHQSFLESKGFVWNKALEAYIKPNSNFQNTDWYKKKVKDVLGKEEKGFHGTTDRF